MNIRLKPGILSLLCPHIWILLCILSPIYCEDVPVMPKVASTEPSQNLSAEAEAAEAKAAVAESAVVEASGGGGLAEGGVVNELKTNGDVVQSSFEEVPGAEGNFSPQQQEYPFVEVVSQNSGVSNGCRMLFVKVSSYLLICLTTTTIIPFAPLPQRITDGSPGVVVTMVDTATSELQQRAELSSQNPEDSAAPPSNATDTPLTPIDEKDNSTQSANVTEVDTEKLQLDVPKIEPKENLTEEIPSFSEWAQKQLEEAEKKREEVNSSAQNHHWNGRNTSNLKVRSKNYASPDCGAKIVAANPEAVSPSSVLSPSRDEYKLNACTNRIWFIVELCEAIQAKKIDLANFELFSSSPKDFSVSVSDRFPSREWSNVGHFTAKDERDVQSFELNPHLFGKYIKVEMHSHHGSEHFCPISLFRVYGTSEFEVLEKEDQAHGGQDDDDDDEAVDSEKGQSPKNLFSSATDAVISIVKKAAEVLGNKGNISNSTSAEDSHNVIKYTPLISTCTTPSHIVVCDNCSDILFGKVYELLSCSSKQINNLLGINLIQKTIYNTPICLQFGLDFHTKRTAEIPNIYSSYVKSFFPPRYLAALCNTVAIIESKVVLNVSNQLNGTNKDANEIHQDNLKTEPTEALNLSEVVTPLKTDDLESTESFNINKIDVSTIDDGITSDISYISQIKPTKTLTPEEMIEITHFVSQEKSTIEEVKPTQTLNEIGEPVMEEDGSGGDSSGEQIVEFEAATESGESLDLEKLISDLENTTASNSTPSPPQIKESVFLRLSNRIKTLERNMSLSSQYLEELSRRYKKQVEEMQRLLEKTMVTLHEESIRKDERNDRLEEKIKHLTEIVEALVAERNNSFNPLHWLVLIVVSMFGIFTFCRRNEHKLSGRSGSAVEVQRRKSIDVINHNAPAKKERRPSEEALKISGTYEHLLVENADLKKKNNLRKRKKKKHLQRSNSITTLSEESALLPKPIYSDISFNFQPGITSSKVWNRQESAPPKVSIEWNGGNGIEEIPFVLEESDHSHLQDMPLPKPLQEPKTNVSSPINGDIPRRKISSPAFLRTTASELRKLRKPSPTLDDRPREQGHKKSASVDETKRQKSPALSTGNVSLNLSFEEQKPLQKKEKKGTFKKMLKKVF